MNIRTKQSLPLLLCFLVFTGLTHAQTKVLSLSDDSLPEALPELPDDAMSSLDEPSLSFSSELGTEAKTGLEEFESVLSQVRILRELRAQNQQTQSKPNLVSTPAQPIQGPHGSQLKPVPGTDNSVGATTTAPTSSPLPPGTPALTADGQQMESRDPSSLTEGRLLNEPADPFLLAQSLFKVGNYESAYSVLAEMDTKDLKTEDVVWIKFMQGMALKRIGKVEAASALLREVANERSRYLKAEAKWWLNHYEQIRARSEYREMVSSTASQLLEEANSYVRAQK